MVNTQYQYQYLQEARDNTQYQYQYCQDAKVNTQYQYQYRAQGQYLNTNTRYCWPLVSLNTLCDPMRGVLAERKGSKNYKIGVKF